MSLYMRPDGAVEVTPRDLTRRMLRRIRNLPRRGGRGKQRGKGNKSGKARR